jgi:hypothetical protein
VDNEICEVDVQVEGGRRMRKVRLAAVHGTVVCTPRLEAVDDKLPDIQIRINAKPQSKFSTPSSCHGNRELCQTTVISQIL